VISESEALKAYGRNIDVVRKGDSRWTSDNHLDGRQGESYGVNPTSKMEQGMMVARRHERIAPESDPNSLDVGTKDFTGDGRDLYEWVVADVRDIKRRAYAHIDPDDRNKDARMHVWRLRATHRNGAL
jgi:hypothetical protein